MDRNLSLFAQVVASGSLSAAARALGISPAMVSKRIAALEARLGARLFHRNTRRVELTAVGEEFHREVVAILAALRAAEARLSGESGVSGPLRLSAPTSFGRMHVAPHLGTFLDRYPRVQLSFDLSDAFEDLVAARIDLAIRIAAELPAGLEAHRLVPSRRVLCAAPAYLAAHGEPTGIPALAGHRLLAASGQLPWRLADADGAHMVTGRSHVATNSSEVVRELALAGIGIALRSLWDVSAELEAGRLVRVLASVEGAAEVAVFAVHPRGTPSPAARAMLDFLRELWSPAPPWARG